MEHFSSLSTDRRLVTWTDNLKDEAAGNRSALQDLINKAIDRRWLSRISLVIRAKRGHIERRLD